MWTWARPDSPPAAAAGRPTLDLSGPLLRAGLEALIAGCEDQGGVEAYVQALRLKAAMFQDALSDGKAATLPEATFKTLCAFMGPVRRRVGPSLAERGIEGWREALAALLDGAADASTADARMRAFCARFPSGRGHRWVRDLAAEVLHYSDPERYPLMCRWVWDSRANTGVLREIWYGENVDHMVIDVADDHQAFLVLREELSQFLSDNGVFRDVLFYVDLLCAQVYAGYINAQGGSYLRTDFSAPDDPAQYVRRLLGLDGVKAGGRATRLKTVDGEAHVIDDVKLLD